jgi:hypothetical protein
MVIHACETHADHMPHDMRGFATLPLPGQNAAATTPWQKH